LDGAITVDGKKIPIQHVSLEEDAARKTGAEGLTVRYRIDRLCVPLIEITTGPVIYTPEEAENVALAVGRILRATRKVKRGLGTIRQDLNVSIRDGALIEIKGVQELELIALVVKLEVQRQLKLLEIRDELKKRELKQNNFSEDLVDVTSAFTKTGCHIIQKALGQGKRVFAVKLPKFAGLLGTELVPNLRLGTEIADRARFWGRVGGILHTDELPSYGVSDDEIRKLRQTLNTETVDAIVLVADTKENAVDALRAAVERAREALKGVPEETRAANPDGTTRYMRPRPGAARMYPETDVPPIGITDDYIKQLRSRLPEPPEKMAQRIVKNYGLNEKIARQIQDSEYLNLFEEIAGKTGVSSTFIAAAFTETFKALKRDGVEVGKVSDDQLMEVFQLVDTGKTPKEAVPNIISWLAQHEGSIPSEAVKALGLSMISEQELARIIDDIVSKYDEVVRERGADAFGFLMGLVMREYRGKVQPEQVSRALKEKLPKNK
jgi:glutamyl-tRNA(Gln) amidotransferase subunit E